MIRKGDEIRRRIEESFRTESRLDFSNYARTQRRQLLIKMFKSKNYFEKK